MQECYRKAAEFRGKGSLVKMKNTIVRHVHEKIIMFEKAKDVMLNQLKALMEDILKTLQETMMESIELSLKTDDNSIPDVPTELSMVKKHYDDLKGGPDEEPSQLGSNPEPSISGQQQQRPQSKGSFEVFSFS